MTAPHDSHARPPPGWDREVPRYKVTRPLKLAAEVRFQFEPPIATMDSDVWQYWNGPGKLKRFAVVATRNWPHPSFEPLNESARRVHEWFLARNGRSPLPARPWVGDRIELVELDDGTSPMQPKSSIANNGDAA